MYAKGTDNILPDLGKLHLDERKDCSILESPDLEVDSITRRSIELNLLRMGKVCSELFVGRIV